MEPDSGTFHTPRVQSGATTTFARGGFVQGGVVVPLGAGRPLYVEGLSIGATDGRRPHEDCWRVQ